MESRQRKIKIIFTTDIHGNYFPYDFRHERWGKGSLQRVHGFVAQQCRHNPGGTILIDGGDILQGEPTSYYFNNICSRKYHRVADFCNFIGYDVGIVGNHDIEAGHDVFDNFVEHCNYPILGANVTNRATGLPYFEPYTILHRCGLKIAVVGFVTPAIPHWIPRKIWGDMIFEDIEESAQHWIQHVRQTEQPDFIIGLFHSGMDEGIVTPEYKENAVRATAEHVEGFDLILYGHDHASNMEEVETNEGGSVMCINPGCYAHSVAEIDVKFHMNHTTGKVTRHELDARVRYIGTLKNMHSEEFHRHFHRDFKEVLQYSEEPIGRFTERVDVTDAYFGSSAYIDLIQRLQLDISGADISFSAPLFFNASIEAGPVKVSNLYNLYRFEDHLYTINMYGCEIKRYLEMSYAGWTCRMTEPDDQMLQIGPMKKNPERIGFVNFIFNFDSAAGIIYEVDVTKPEGERVNIISMANGDPFRPFKEYRVAMTAYRANGGGELLTRGAGLTKQDIERRIVDITEHDIRHYLLEYVRQHVTITPQPMNHWRFVPEDWATAAIARERQILFGP